MDTASGEEGQGGYRIIPGGGGLEMVNRNSLYSEKRHILKATAQPPPPKSAPWGVGQKKMLAVGLKGVSIVS